MELQLPQAPVPVFPLPGVFLFPQQVLPLHVFEPRYRAMIADLLDKAGRFVIGTTSPPMSSPAMSSPAAPAAFDAADRLLGGASPGMLPVAGLGEILRHEALPDGRFMIWVLGLVRVRIEEVPSTKPYRQVQCHPFVEIDVPEFEADSLARQLHAATSARLSEPLPLPDSTPPSLLADLLLQTLRAPQALVERAFAEPSVSRRAQLALRAARRSTHDGESLGDSDV